MFSVMWSEHCSYKSSRPLPRGRCPRRAPTWSPGPGENAGVVAIGDGLAVAFKLESHNHPSAVEPYQGAATGVGGILRDIFTMGARPIAVLDALKFGDPSDGAHPAPGARRRARRRRLRQLRRRARPSAASWSSTRRYAANPLVNVMAVGLLEERHLTLRGGARARATSSCSSARPPAATASAARASWPAPPSTRTSAAKRPTVQVGDPFAEKLLIEASLELIERRPRGGAPGPRRGGHHLRRLRDGRPRRHGHPRRPRRDPAARGRTWRPSRS